MSAWGALNGATWVRPDIRDAVVDLTTEWSAKTEFPADQLIAWIGIQCGKCYNWKQRYGNANEHNGRIPSDHWLAPIKRQAIVAFHDRHPLDDDRWLTYMMLDADIVAAGPSTVHSVLSAAGCLDHWNRKPSKKGTSFVQPLKHQDHWRMTRSGGHLLP